MDAKEAFFAGFEFVVNGKGNRPTDRSPSGSVAPGMVEAPPNALTVTGSGILRVDVLYRSNERIHRWTCRFTPEDFPEWSYWSNEGAWTYNSLQHLIATDAPWLAACKVCKPTGWALDLDP